MTCVADAFLGCKIHNNWPAVGWIEGEVVKRNFARRMKTGSDIFNFVTPPSAES